MWTIADCPVCSGSGWRYCSRCEDRCEHDRICERCRGEGELPIKADFVALMVSSLLFRTRAEVWAFLEEE